MALIKCPECGHQVSEFADFCPGCGCKISYIKDYYQKLEEQRIKAERKAARENVPDFYSTLSGQPKIFIDKIIQIFQNSSVDFYFDNRKEFAGFRRAKKEPLVAYLSRHVNGDLVIHLYSVKLEKNSSSIFEDEKLEAYVDYVKYSLFKLKKTSVDINKENEPIEQIDEAKFKHYKVKYLYAIRDNRVEKITIDKIVKSGDKYRVYFVFGDGTQKFCTLDNIQNILFETFTSASSFIKHPRHSVELPNNGTLVSNRSRAFVIFDRTTATYFSGFHTTQNYETYRKQFGKNLGSYTTSEVPDFTYKIEKAQRFFSKEGAESLIKKIQDVCNPLEIIEHLFNN